MRLAQRVKGAIVQYDARDQVHRAGLKDALGNVALHHLVLRGGPRLAEGRKIHHRIEQKHHRHRAQQGRQIRIQPLPDADLRARKPLHRGLAVPGVGGIGRLVGGKALVQPVGQIKLARVPAAQLRQKISLLFHPRPSF